MSRATVRAPVSSPGHGRSGCLVYPPSIPVPVTSARSSSRRERRCGLTRPRFYYYTTAYVVTSDLSPCIVAPDRARADARGRSQIVDRWQPRVSDEEKGRKEQPDHDGRDERSVESVEGVASAPRHRGAPWRDRWPRRHGGRPTRSRRAPTGGCTVPRSILATRPSHAPSPFHTPHSPSPLICGRLLAGHRSARSSRPACPFMPRSYPIPRAPSTCWATTRWVTPSGVHRRAGSRHRRMLGRDRPTGCTM